MQAIQTKFIPPTKHRGARIKAWCERGSVTVSYHSGSSDPRLDAFNALIARFNKEDEQQHGPGAVNPGRGWNSPFVRGTLPNGDEAFVFVTK